MRIATIIKQVPDSNAAIRVSASGDGIDTAGLKMVVDPFDEFGVELAVQLREKRGDVDEIVVFTIGGDKAAEALRTALAMGADRAVHINDESLISYDEVYAAAILSSAIKAEEGDFDLILCGKYTIDLDAGAVGPALGEFMGIPHIAATVALDIAADGRSFTARRRIEGAEEVYEGSTPVVLTIEKGLVEPRYPSLPNLMKAKKKPVAVKTAADISGLDAFSAGLRVVTMSPPPPAPDCTMIDGEPEDMARELVRLLREEAKVI